MQPTVVLTENGPDSSSLTARNVRDLAHVRRLLLQALLATSETEAGEKELSSPAVALTLLRNFLHSIGRGERASGRQLLLLALVQQEDEADECRRVMPHPLLPIVRPGR